MKLETFLRIAAAYVLDGDYLASRTKDNFQVALNNLAAFAADRPISEKLIYAWTDYLKQDGYSINTIHLMRRQIRSMCRWGINQGLGNEQFVKPIRNFPQQPTTRIDKIISVAEYKRILEYAHADSWWPEIIRLGWESGLRLSDCVSLRKLDVDLVAGALHLHPFKTRRYGRQLDLPLLPEMHRLLAKRLEGPMPDKNCQTFEVFVWPKAAEDYVCSRQSLSGYFRKVALACGVRCPQFHALRHGRVTTLLEAGESTGLVRSITGHSLKVLQVYMDHISLEAKRKALQRAADFLEQQVTPTP